MSAKKPRPAKGTPVTEGMSLRDIASALGTSTAFLCQAMRLAEVPREDFEAIVENDDLLSNGQRMSSQRIVNLSRGLDGSPRRASKRCPHCGKGLDRP